MYTSAIRMWNNLDESLKTKPTISSFMQNLKTITFQSSNFAFGKRHLSVSHARIRNNCSNFNNDPFNNHLRDKPFVVAINTEMSVTNSLK